jgi:hypothetical protein
MELVRRFFREGPPASRNLAFEAYREERFARAVRIYQYLVSVRDHLLELTREGAPVELQVDEAETEVVVVVRYQRGQLERTAYLKPPEWELLREEPALAALLLARPR